MLKKIVIICLIIIALFATTSVYAISGNEILESEQATELVEIKESTKAKLDEYIEKYGSKPYGLAAFVLNIVRVYSIPFCLIGIAVGAMYQYIIGIRRLDIRDRGFRLIITFVTILLIAQVLPLIFAVIVNGWRG